MAIRFSKYVDITSGVIGANAVPERSFAGRLFTDNNLLPPQTVGIFDTAADVAAYFGSSSAEYLRAVQYFGFVSKQIASPTSIQFARWVDTAVAPMIFGNTTAKLLATYTAVTAGGFTLTLGGVALAMTGINLSAAPDLTTVAADIQTKIRTGTGTAFTAATVNFDNTTNRFNFVGGATGAATISVTDGAQGVAAALGWLTGSGLVVAPGSALETPDGSFNTSVSANDNLGGFLFIPAPTLNQATAIGNANDALNESFLDCLAIATANAASWTAAMGGISGIAPTISPLTTEYPEQDPMMILAATDYTRRGAAQNYMYQVFSNQTPSVTDDTTSDTYDALPVNYYGQTMKNGRVINFYQRGIMWGGISDARDIGIYCNEMWLKSAMGEAIMDLLLAATQVPANATGRGMLLGVSAPVIAQAQLNGTIEIGKTLTAQQQAAIFTATGDPNAWRQVQTIGYWIDWVIAPFTNTSGIQEYKATYTLVYSKADSIRTVFGSNELV